MSFKIIESKTKEDIRLMPFLTFPITKSCNFRCQYCGQGGELSASRVEKYQMEDIKQKALIAHKKGIRKFRLTGGEPFTFAGIMDLLRFFDNMGVYLHVNTNGSLVSKYKEELKELGDNIHFAVSLDSLNEELFDQLSGTNGMFEKVISGIEMLSEIGKLLRINMVVTRLNEHELMDIVDFCKKLNCDLKLLDVVSVPVPYGDRKDLHVPFIELEKYFNEISNKTVDHQYARGFGTPCKIYRINGVNVTVKSTWNGSRYDINGICKGCSYFPCHEGLYDIFALPDSRIVGCRWSEESVVNEEKTFEEQLEHISRIFQRAEYIERETNNAMQPYPDFVMKSLNKEN